MENSVPTPTDFDDLTFREFTEFNVEVMRSAAQGGGHGGIASIDVNEVSHNSVDFDARFRSIQAMNPASFAEFAPLHCEPSMVAGPPSLARDLGPTVSRVTDTKSHIEIIPQSSGVPEKPIYIAPSHFVCHSSIGDIRMGVDRALNQVFEVSYKYCPSDCRWEAVYLRGPARCKFEVNVYKDGGNAYIVEGNRLSGDAFPFRSVFNTVRTCLLPDTEDARLNSRSSHADSIALPASEDLSMEEARPALNAIMEMARSKMVDTQVEAAKIFCDLSLQQSMHLLLCDSGCVSVLVDLLQVEYDFCSHHAACALANLSSSRSCQDILLNNSAFLPTLMRYTVDGPYDSSEMRRECTRMLANICAGLAPRVVDNLGMDAVSSWVSGVSDLKDERLRMHAERARQYILPCM